MKRIMIAVLLSLAAANANAAFATFGIGGSASGSAAGASSVTAVPFVGLLFLFGYIIKADMECRATPGCKPVEK